MKAFGELERSVATGLTGMESCIAKAIPNCYLRKVSELNCSSPDLLQTLRRPSEQSLQSGIDSGTG